MLLRNAELPLLKLNEESKEVEHVPHSKFKLNLLTKPVSTTIALFDENVLLVDPSHDEEDLSSGTITIVLGSDKELYSVHKPGGFPVNDQLLQDCMKYAILRHAELSELLGKVEEDVDR